MRRADKNMTERLLVKNIYVLGLLDWQRRELETISNAERYRFHSLLTYEELVESHAGFDDLLERARKALRSSATPPDAIVCHWDFPSSCLAPVLARDFGLRAPSLESVLRCEHKYWSRLEQRKVVPECVPQFQALDPYDPHAADRLELEYPIWLKPVKGFSSMLGFYIENRTQLKEALEQMREGIGELGKPFDECLAHVELPPEVQGIGGRHALAESIMSGEQHAPEGYVLDGDVHIHGCFDMLRAQGGKSISALRYPAELDPEVEQRSAEVCRKVLNQVGFDNGCYNLEFLWDEQADKLWLIEVNTRISQSHSELFRQVDGMSNHEVAVRVALGERPRLPEQRGPYSTAGKFLLNKVGDAEVVRVPDRDEVSRISRELGDAFIDIDVEPGMRLSDLPNQAEYQYVVGEAWLGAQDSDELMSKYRNLIERIPFEFSDQRPLQP